ncbi:glycoprotein [Raoultella ornithinolytica]|uniref:glycoprotein n=1 Tax=Raoultella ornithinolytica TaxID=54291 RepID=UPI000CF30970|nr:glycoprotein [Raoultella ornithinolytica]PQH11580.1 glycoprotein [Raoultella ornithinolytica]PQH33171.1 glycoprotein [Raoultella ornithinolytica]
MAKYQVVRSWHGVIAGQVVEMDGLHPSLKPHVILISEGELTPATPEAKTGRKRKAESEEE